MAIVEAQADPNDGVLFAQAWKYAPSGEVTVPPPNADYEDDARRGEGVALEEANTPETGQRLRVGGMKWNNGDQTGRFESFIQFPPGLGFVQPSGSGFVELVTSALRVSRKGITYNNPNDGVFGAKDSLAFWNIDWSGDLSTSQWFNLMSISGSGSGSSYQPEGELAGWIQDHPPLTGVFYEGGGEEVFKKVRDKLSLGSLYSLVLLSWTSTQVYPGPYQWIANIASANDVLTAPKYHPTLRSRFQRKHALNGVGGASIQMTDGTAVFLRFDPITNRYNLYYQKVNSTTPVLIDYLRGKVGATDNSEGNAQYFGYEPGFQSYGLTRDDNNNIYVIGPRGNPQTGTYGQKVANSCAYKYDGNYTWGRFTQTIVCDNTLSATDTHRGFINNVVPVWLRGGAYPTGRLVVVHSRRDGQWARYQTGVYVHNAGWNIGDVGIVKGANIGYAGDDSDTSTWWRPYNSSGSNLDAFRDGDTVRIATALPATPYDDAERSGGLTTVIAAGNSMSKPTPIASSIGTNSPHDPDGKMRAVWLGDGSQFWGIARYGHIQVLRKSDGSIYRQVDFPSNGVAGFPSRAVLQKSQAWDVVWDSNDPDWIWMYFKSSINPRVINKVRWNYTTGQIDTPFQFTASPLGASGSEIVAIRVPRQQVDARCVLVDVAMQDGTGAPAALITVRDTTMNKAPNPPVVSAISSFNASGSKIVEWLFSDSNPLDFATFQDVEIVNVATGAISHAVSHSTAVVVSAAAKRYRYTIPAAALTNDTSYQIRFRAYDSVEFPSDWSAPIQFSTTATGGLVLITEPAEDNAPLNRAAFTVKWTYSNSTPSTVQTGYRVRVFNNATGASVYDSNLITSTATSHDISGLTSDIEYRVEVTIRDSVGQTSGAGMRLVTPDFNNPSLPDIVATSLPGRIDIRVTNPPPTGDNPVTVKNQIARKEADEPEEAYLVIGECPPNGVYQDWTVASGVEYTYKARGSSE